MNELDINKSKEVAGIGEYSRTGLSLPEGLPIETWVDIGERISEIEGAVMWWMGDWWRYGEHEYGDRSAQALDSDYSFQTWADAGWVARKIETSRRREVVSWSIHREVAVLSPPQQDRLLLKAESDGLTVKDVRQLVRRLKNGLDDDEPVALPDGKYNVIYADPPWQYEFSKSDSREIENQYTTMELEQICAMPVSSICAEDCVLYMWTTSPKLIESFDVLSAWGFEYKTCGIWDKQKIGMGYYFRQQHEILLVATKGSLPVPEPSDRPSSIFSYPRGKHSVKPLEIIEMLTSMYPKGKRIELFCRDPQNGWDVWGNQSAS